MGELKLTGKPFDTGAWGTRIDGSDAVHLHRAIQAAPHFGALTNYQDRNSARSTLVKAGFFFFSSRSCPSSAR